jgi:hypothetical protein
MNVTNKEFSMMLQLQVWLGQVWSGISYLLNLFCLKERICLTETWKGDEESATIAMEYLKANAEMLVRS